MEHSAGLRKIARLNCAGGGQVVVDRQFAYLGHMDPGVGTSIADVSDPLNARIVAQVPVAPGFHSHKVRASNGLMLVNRDLARSVASSTHVRRERELSHATRDARCPQSRRRSRASGRR